MSFQFRNMQTFIRNCIEPHAIALKQSLLANDRVLKKEIETHVNLEIDELKKLINSLINSLKQEVTTDLEDLNDKIDNFSTISIGSILPWPALTNPVDWNKWLECNGDIFNTTKYKDLAALLKSNTTPDYRGYFLRGVGGHSAALNVHQGDAIRNIYASIPIDDDAVEFVSGALRINGGRIRWDANSRDAGSYSAYDGSFNASYIVPTALENRPTNKAVRFLIRALQ